ncbi:MAG: xylulokinase, partial [Clostridia bacterium]|nr:xylulokinase [Clostridia bacterium]
IWAQMTADALGMTLRITESADSSFGSAMLAGIAIGVFDDPKAATALCVKPLSVIIPNPENTAKYQEIFKTYKSVQAALAPIYK